MNSNEFQLLLYCARSCPDAGAIRALVDTGIDWQVLLKLAEQNRVRPMLCQSLREVCWDAVPNKIQIELTLFNKANAQRNLIFTGDLLRLLGVFQQHAIPIAAFKGPVLANSVYGHISLREFSDLDLIVRKADLLKAEDILTACGYQANFADISSACIGVPDNELGDYRSAFLSYLGQYAFRHSQTGISVDLHWRLGVPFPLQSAEIWTRLEKVTIGGRTVPTLAQDDLALFLAAHGTKEGWRTLLWVCDFAELLRKNHNIDWAAILDRAQRSHFSRPLLVAIALCSALLDAPAPAALIARARENSAVQALAEEAKLRMLRPEPEDELQQFLKHLKTHDRLRQRFWPVVTLLTTRTVSDYQKMPLPKWLWGIYYFTRPFRLAIKVVMTSWSKNSPVP
jgi:hypothetical protein